MVNSKINILHSRPAVSEALKMCLYYSNYEEIGVFHNLAELLTQVDINHIHLIDTQFVIQFLNEQKGNINFSILVTADNDHNIVEALYAGATSFINIAKGPAHFVNCIELIMENKADEPSEFIRNFLKERRQPQNVSEKEIHNLTNKEVEILKMMRDGNHLKLIAQITSTSYETVRTHVKRIYKKLGVMSASEAVIKAMKMNL